MAKKVTKPKKTAISVTVAVGKPKKGGMMPGMEPMMPGMPPKKPMQPKQMGAKMGNALMGMVKPKKTVKKAAKKGK